MILSSSGREFTVPGKNIKVSAKAQFDRKDLSGGGSSTSFAAAGNKSKTIDVSLTLPTAQKSELTDLTEIAEAVNQNGDPVIYTVIDDMCQAMNIRTAIFNGELRSVESTDLQAWDISFSLKECNSVAEKREEREQLKDVSKNSEEKAVGSLDPVKVNEAAKA